MKKAIFLFILLFYFITNSFAQNYDLIVITLPEGTQSIIKSFTIYDFQNNKKYYSSDGFIILKNLRRGTTQSYRIEADGYESKVVTLPIIVGSNYNYWNYFHETKRYSEIPNAYIEGVELKKSPKNNTGEMVMGLAIAGASIYGLYKLFSGDDNNKSSSSSSNYSSSTSKSSSSGKSNSSSTQRIVCHGSKPDSHYKYTNEYNSKWNYTVGGKVRCCIYCKLDGWDHMAQIEICGKLSGTNKNGYGVECFFLEVEEVDHHLTEKGFAIEWNSSKNYWKYLNDAVEYYRGKSMIFQKKEMVYCVKRWN